MNENILTKIFGNRHLLSLGLILLFSTVACQKNNSTPITVTTTNNPIMLPETGTLAAHLEKMTTVRLQTPDGKALTTILAITPSDQERGLSGTKPEERPIDYAMLFASLEDTYRTFWMPDTYFDLDIFFIDKDLKIVAIERKIAHHEGRENESSIARTRSYLCRHVLEMNSNSALSLSLNVGDKLSWMESISLEQTVSSTLQKK